MSNYLDWIVLLDSQRNLSDILMDILLLRPAKSHLRQYWKLLCPFVAVFPHQQQTCSIARHRHYPWWKRSVAGHSAVLKINKTYHAWLVGTEIGDGLETAVDVIIQGSRRHWVRNHSRTFHGAATRSCEICTREELKKKQKGVSCRWKLTSKDHTRLWSDKAANKRTNSKLPENFPSRRSAVAQPFSSWNMLWATNDYPIFI